MTRTEHLNSTDSNKHDIYYSQFVTSVMRYRVGSINRERIINSTEKHFNDIPLAEWDALALPCPAEVDFLLRAQGDFPTLAGLVSILKQAATLIRANAKQTAK